MGTRQGVRVRFAVLVVAVAMVISGCGTTVGPAGPEGAMGPPGSDGNANVVAAVVQVSDADWGTGSYVYRSGPGSTTSRAARVVELDVPQITQEIYDLGMVHVFMQVPRVLGGESVLWTPLPYHYLAFGGAYYFNVVFTYEVGKLTLYYFHTTNDASTPPSVTTWTLPDMTIKYVIASGTALAGLVADGVDPSDAMAAAAHLGAAVP